MHPIIFTIGSLSFYTHGALAVLGIVVATLVIFLLSKNKLDCTYLFDNIIYSVLVGIIGARLLFFLLYPNQLTSLKDFFQFWHGGLVSYGGFITGSLTLYVLLKSQKQPLSVWFDRVAIAFPLGLSIARLGEFISGENFGIASSSMLSVDGKMPISLLEACWCLIIFIFMLILFKKSPNIPKGIFALSVILLYCAGRFAIDFWRNESEILAGISLGQLTSLTLFLATLAPLLIHRFKKRGKYETV